jgi:hypothetical protein
MGKHGAASGEAYRPKVDAATALLLSEAGAPAPPDCYLPKGWHLDLSGVPVPPPPQTAAAHAAEVARRRAGLSSPQRAEPKYAPDSPDWAVLFQAEHDAQRYSSRHGQARERWNAAKRRRIWAQVGPDGFKLEREVPAGGKPEIGEPARGKPETEEPVHVEPETEEPVHDKAEPAELVHVKPEPEEAVDVKPEPEEAVDVKPEPEEQLPPPPNHEPSDELEWPGTMAACLASLEVVEQPPPPKHEPGDEEDWPGTMAAYRASVEDVTIIIDDD